MKLSYFTDEEALIAYIAVQEKMKTFTSHGNPNKKARQNIRLCQSVLQKLASEHPVVSLAQLSSDQLF